MDFLSIISNSNIQNISYLTFNHIIVLNNTIFTFPSVTLL